MSVVCLGLRTAACPGCGSGIVDPPLRDHVPAAKNHRKHEVRGQTWCQIRQATIHETWTWKKR